MEKILGEYYLPIVWGLWITWVPMVVKDEFGFVPSLCSAIVAGGIGAVLANATKTKASKIKLITLIGSVAVIIGFTALVVTPEVASTAMEQSEQVE